MKKLLFVTCCILFVACVSKLKSSAPDSAIDMSASYSDGGLDN